MNSTPRLGVLALGLVAIIAACEDDPTIPPPPEQPPQIGYNRAYTRGTNGLPDVREGNEVTSFAVLSDGQFWIGTAAGVARYADTGAAQSTEIVNEVNGLPHPQVRGIVEHGGKVYVGTWGGGIGVYDMTADSWSQIRPGPTGLTDGFISGIASSPTEVPSRIYFSTNNGVFIYDPAGDTFTHFDTVDDDLEETDLVTPKIQQVVSDVEVHEEAGVVQRWYAPRVEVRLSAAEVPRHGITISKPATTYKYTKANSGLAEPNVNDVYYDSVTNTFWVAYVNKGVSQVDVAGPTWKTYNLVQGLPSNTVMSITRAKDNTSANSVIWAATQNGLAKLVNGHWESYGVAGGLPSSRLRSVFSDNGQRLWVGFVDAGAVRIAN